MILKHNIKKLTSEEIGFINQEFKHWDELQHRDWVTERIAEKSDSYTNKYMEHFQFLIDQEPSIGQFASEEWLRIKFQEFQKKETEWIREKVRDYVATSISELEDFITWLEQCYEHHTIFIDEGLKFYVGRGYEIKTPYDECQERLILEECEKFNTE